MSPDILAKWIVEHDFEYDRDALYATLRFSMDSEEATRVLKKAERLAFHLGRLYDTGRD